MNEILTTTYTSPCGTLVLGDFQGSLCLCDWLDTLHGERTRQRVMHRLHATKHDRHSALLKEASHQLDEYFQGKRFEFDLPFKMEGTPFQVSVWQRLSAIPYACQCTYAQLAVRALHPNSVRAVANAVGANPLCIFLPCHRVVASGGHLGGYAGGADAKRFLLEMEHDFTHIT